MGNDIAEIKPVDSAIEKSIFTVEMIPTFTNDAAATARAKAGVHAAYVFPKDPNLVDKFEQRDYKLAWIEICAEYLQMCVESMATVGQYFPPLESENTNNKPFSGVLSSWMWTWVCRGVLNWRSSELYYPSSAASRYGTACRIVYGCAIVLISPPNSSIA